MKSEPHVLNCPTLTVSRSYNKEEPHRNGKALLQLTTYETQSSLLVAAGALSFTATGGLL